VPKRKATWCLGRRKARYRDHEEAAGALFGLRLLAEQSGSTPPVRAYACGICKGWHLTGQTEEEYFEQRDAFGT
jgi:hypothetical protein